jgi:hypothetical protein
VKCITTVLTIFACALLASCDSVDFVEKTEPLPAEFADYKGIDEISEFGNFTVEKFKDSSGPTEHKFDEDTNNVIIKVTAKIDDDHRQTSFYKLDSSGKIIDTHQFVMSYLIADATGDEEWVGNNFLVNKELGYYTTWPLNGSNIKRPFIEINADRNWSEDKVREHYSDIVMKSAYLDDVETWENISEGKNKKRIAKVYYLRSTGEWYILYGNSLTEDGYGRPLSGFNNTLFENFTSNERFFGRYIPPSNITISYFQKLKYEKYCAANQVGCSMFYSWGGMGYYNVAIGGSILKFKNKGSLSTTEFKNKVFPPKESLLVNFAYFTHQNLTYALFSANDVLYIIKQKKSANQGRQRQ